MKKFITIAVLAFPFLATLAHGQTSDNCQDSLDCESSWLGITTSQRDAIFEFAEEYKEFIKGTRILTLEEAKGYMGTEAGFSSLAGSSKISDDFNVANKVYDQAQDLGSYIDLSIMGEL